LHVTDKRQEGNIGADERNNIMDENDQVLQWLTDQLSELEKRFSPYLKFKVWKYSSNNRRLNRVVRWVGAWRKTGLR